MIKLLILVDLFTKYTKVVYKKLISIDIAFWSYKNFALYQKICRVLGGIFLERIPLIFQCKLGLVNKLALLVFIKSKYFCVSRVSMKAG